MQSEFIKQCSAERIIPLVEKKIKKRAEEGYDIFCTYDKEGGNLISSVAEICGTDKVFTKHVYGSEELVFKLKDINPDVIEFIGVCTDVCVITNVITTMTFLPFTTLIVDANCCAAADGGHLAAIKVMESCNIKII